MKRNKTTVEWMPPQSFGCGALKRGEHWQHEGPIQIQLDASAVPPRHGILVQVIGADTKLQNQDPSGGGGVGGHTNIRLLGRAGRGALAPITVEFARWCFRFYGEQDSSSLFCNLGKLPIPTALAQVNNPFSPS
ncbi:hypothetical protein CGCF413_v011375 [Colletotrichum fructicola]|nr:hypothetical protein CGCF413_v011375 [Colletotrichum fructicola]